MGSVNKVILVGNLGRDAELRYTPGGAPVATLNLATTEVWNDKGGQRQEKTEWHRVVLWGKTAESLSEYLTKGKQIYVEGRLQTRKWDDKDGNKRYTTEIRGDRVVLLGGGGGGGGGVRQRSRCRRQRSRRAWTSRWASPVRADGRRYSVLSAARSAELQLRAVGAGLMPRLTSCPGPSPATAWPASLRSCRGGFLITVSNARRACSICFSAS